MARRSPARLPQGADDRLGLAGLLRLVSLTVGAPFALGGCPLTDAYHVDPDWGTGGQAVSHGGATGTGGASPGAAGCNSANCSGSCCGTTCHDLMTESAHCGACDVVCSVGRSCFEGRCAGGWVSMTESPQSFVARDHAAFVSFDNKVFIFGGLDRNGAALRDGAIYDPRADTWKLISVDAGSTSRQLATAIWTARGVLVVGGTNASSTTYYSSAALYDVTNDSWSSAGSASMPRAAAGGGATEETAVLWGGLTTGGNGTAFADRYAIASGGWQAAFTFNGPGPLLGATWTQGGDSLFVYGGLVGGVRTNQAYHYNLTTDTWSALPPGPSARSSAFGVWDGVKLYVWGGSDGSGVRSDGAVFESAAWTPMLQVGAPGARRAPPRDTGWAFALGDGDLLFLGGTDASGNALRNGLRYQSGGWTTVDAWSSNPDETHRWGVAAKAGGEIVVWGGYDGTSATSSGQRWAP